MRAFLLSLLAVLPVAAHGDASTCDTSNDRAAAETWQRVMGQALPACFARARSFPGIVTVGTFAHDRGCSWDQTLDLCHPDNPDLTSRAMLAAGWFGTKTQAWFRGELALSWLEQVEHYEILRSKPEAWKGGKKFAAPTTTPDGKGLVVRFWAQLPSGMQPVYNFVRYEVRFDARAVPAEAKAIDQHDVPMN